MGVIKISDNTKTKKKKEKKKKPKRPVLKGFLIILGTIIVLSLLFLILNFKNIKNFYDTSVEKINDISYQTFLSKMPTVIYDKNGKVIREFGQSDYKYINFKDIKPEISHAFVAIEDERFFEHNGVDLKALSRAALNLVKHKGQITQGGSTITQQLVKNTVLTHEQSFKRKFEEIIIASKLEDLYSKEQILEFYLNNIYFGNGNYGIETASENYFSKPSKDLTLSECAFLAAIPNNPTYYDPINNINNTLERRNLILDKMLEQNYITKEQYEEAIKEKIKLNLKPKEEYQPEGYMTTYAMDCTIRELMAKNGFQFKTQFKTNEERQAYFDNFDTLYQETNAHVRKGGYKIYTSLDPEKQKILQQALDDNLAMYSETNMEDGLYTIQGAAVSIDNATGDVVAIVGGRTQEDVYNTFNRGYLAVRQPGSAIKPLVAYTPAFERGYTGYSMVNDKAINKGPSNWDKTYRGNVSIEYATEISINTIPFNLVNEIGTETALDYLRKMNFKYIMPSDNTPIVAVGGFTKGVTPVELAGAYSTLAREGSYIKTTCIEKIQNYDNETLYENKHNKVPVYNNLAADEMTSVLKGVLTKPYATGYGLALDKMPSAGKTGTTDADKDSWFCGYTPYYTTVVYIGADTPQTIPSSPRGSVPGLIWKNYMTKIHENLPPKDFFGNYIENYSPEVPNNTEPQQEIKNDTNKPKDENNSNTNKKEPEKKPENNSEIKNDNTNTNVEKPNTNNSGNTNGGATEKPENNGNNTEQVPPTQQPAPQEPVQPQPAPQEPVQPQPAPQEPAPQPPVSPQPNPGTN